MSDEHYLKKELYEQTTRDPAIIDSLCSGCVDGISYWDLENPDNAWMSARFWETLGYDPASEHCRSSNWQQVIYPDDLRLVRENIAQHRADAHRPLDQEVRYTRKDGSTVWVRFRGVAIGGQDGKPNRMLGVHTDITARKRAEADASQLASQLATANREMESFSYSVSHDLRAPLRAVDGFSRMLAEDCASRLDDEGQRMVGLIRDSTQQMGRLIEAILVFSRLNRQKIETTPIDMHGMAQDVFDELAALNSKRDLRLDLHPLKPARGTWAMIRLVWANLIGNAVKFTSGRAVGQIEVGTQDGEDGAPIYYVKDNGAGFDMRQVGRLFGMFQRLHSDADFSGIGAGLAFVQRIVQRHGGRVWAEAEAGLGAKFYFTLPNHEP